MRISREEGLGGFFKGMESKILQTALNAVSMLQCCAACWLLLACVLACLLTLVLVCSLQHVVSEQLEGPTPI
jgi:hypothetical protein